jgi:dTDP-4-dehydrorhamnose 3,5-epimerase
METYSQRDMAEAGLDIPFVQDNQSMSTKGVLRGLHFQKHFPQTKLVRVIRGAVYDVAEFCYKCDDFYHLNDEGGMAWNDPEIGISWPKLTGEYRGSASGEGYMVDGVALNLSEKDEKWLGIRDTFKF